MEKLNEFRYWFTTCTPTSDLVLKGLSRAKELYICLEEVLRTRSTQQVLSKCQHEKSVEGLLEGSVRILDVCAVSREIVWQIKEHVQDLQSTIRRRRTGPSPEVGTAHFAELRKKVKKEAKRLIVSLKQMGNEIIAASLPISSHEDDHLSEVIRVLREVQLSSILVFQLLVSFLSEPTPARCSVISRVMSRQDADVNELESIHVSLRSLCKPHKVELVEHLHQTVQEQLGKLELMVGSFEDGLECIFRRLIKTRASLLNIISQ